MKTLLYTLSFVLVSTLGVAQITTGYFGGNARLDNVVQPHNGQTANKWIKLAKFSLNGNWNAAGITVDFFPKNSNHGDSRQQLNVQFRNNLIGIESTHDISLVTFYGAQKTIKDVKVIHTSGSGVSNNKFSVWVQIGTSWLGNVPIEVRTYGNVTFKTTNQPYYTSITDRGTVYDLKSSYSMAKSNNIDGLTVKDNGNVGIGTTNPDQKLTVQGHVNIGGTGNGTLRVRHLEGKHYQNANYDHLFINYRSGKDVYIGNKYDNTLKSNLFVSGNVGIGTTTPREKLSVNGKIRAKEVKVELQNWPDYVFSPAYELPTLTEVADFITKNGHLPEIPNAAQVHEEGIELGVMNAKLLQKIEELTLYTLAQEEKLETQQHTIETLITRLNQIESQISNNEKNIP